MSPIEMAELFKYGVLGLLVIVYGKVIAFLYQEAKEARSACDQKSKEMLNKYEALVHECNQESDAMRQQMNSLVSAILSMHKEDRHG